MSQVVLKDGRILELSTSQMEALSMTILMSPSLNKKVKVGSKTFSLDDIVTDPEEILRVTQVEMFNIKPTSLPRKSSKRQELA